MAHCGFSHSGPHFLGLCEEVLFIVTWHWKIQINPPIHLHPHPTSPKPLSAPHPPQTHILPADVARLWSHTSKPPLPDLLHTLTPTLKKAPDVQRGKYQTVANKGWPAALEDEEKRLFISHQTLPLRVEVCLYTASHCIKWKLAAEWFKEMICVEIEFTQLKCPLTLKAGVWCQNFCFVFLLEICV